MDRGNPPKKSCQDLDLCQNPSPMQDLGWVHKWASDAVSGGSQWYRSVVLNGKLASSQFRARWAVGGPFQTRPQPASHPLGLGPALPQQPGTRVPLVPPAPVGGWEGVLGACLLPLCPPACRYDQQLVLCRDLEQQLEGAKEENLLKFQKRANDSGSSIFPAPIRATFLILYQSSVRSASIQRGEGGGYQ